MSCGGSVLHRTLPPNVAARRPHTWRSQAVVCHGCSYSRSECLCRASSRRRLPSIRCPQVNRWRPASDATRRTPLFVFHHHASRHPATTHPHLWGSPSPRRAKRPAECHHVASMARSHSKTLDVISHVLLPCVLFASPCAQTSSQFAHA